MWWHDSKPKVKMREYNQICTFFECDITIIAPQEGDMTKSHPSVSYVSLPTVGRHNLPQGEILSCHILHENTRIWLVQDQSSFGHVSLHSSHHLVMFPTGNLLVMFPPSCKQSSLHRYYNSIHQKHWMLTRYVTLSINDCFNECVKI